MRDTRLSDESTKTARRALGRFDTPLDPDDVAPFHAARLLLLLLTCGSGPSKAILGRTKLAKLDFFVRYPLFLERASADLEPENSLPYAAGLDGVEATMVRYRFGPWDHRYHNLLALLEARRLIRVDRTVKADRFGLTKEGRLAAEALATDPTFEPILARCLIVYRLFGSFTGTQLKEYVYRTFSTEVGRLSSQSVIRQDRRATSR